MVSIPKAHEIISPYSSSFRCSPQRLDGSYSLALMNKYDQPMTNLNLKLEPKPCPTIRSYPIQSNPIIDAEGHKIIPSPALDSNGDASAVVETGALATNNQRDHSASLDASQTARALYPSIARSLQKYLRLTRQAGRHNLQSIHEHLSKCLLYGLSARAFIEKFVQRDPVWQLSETELFANCRLETDATRPKRDDFEINTWSLISDAFVSREIGSGKSIDTV